MSWTDNETLAYLAGFFDGEGSIGVYKDSLRKDRKGEYRLNSGRGFRTEFQVSGYVKVPFEIMQTRFGGTLSQGLSLNKHELFHYSLYNVDGVEKALLSLLPFLTVKAEQARIALEFIEFKRNAHRVFDDTELEMASQFERRLKEEKHK